MVAVALSYRRSFFANYELPHACVSCKDNPERKRRWGCESPSEDEQLWIPCVRCGGEDQDCKLCNGDGREPIYRCPRTMVGAWEGEYRLLHRIWPSVLPRGGGLLDQPLQYVEAMRWLDHAEGLLQKQIQDEQLEASRRK